MIKFWDWLLTLLKPLIVFIGKIGLPKRKITGEHYYRWRDDIEVGTVLLTKTNYELSNIINPTEIKHGGLYVGDINNNGICYVLEALGQGVVLTDLVTFMTGKDIIVACKPKFVRRDLNGFIYSIQSSARRIVGKSYDYLFNADGKAFYCFEAVAHCFKSVYSELQFKSKEIVKGKRIYDENTFLDEDFFEIVFDSRDEI